MEYIVAGEMVEGKKCEITTRKFEFKKGGLRQDPITNQNMVVYELDRNCSVEVVESLQLSEEEIQRRVELKVHGAIGDLIRGDAIRLYVESKRNVLRFNVKEGLSGRHGANVAETNFRTIGVIRTPLDIYKKLLGYSAKSNNKMVETN